MNVVEQKARSLRSNGKICDDCMNALFEEDDPPSCQCRKRLNDLSHETISGTVCIACFEQAVEDFEGQCTDQDSKAPKGYECPRCCRRKPRKDDPNGYPLQRRKNFWRRNHWRRDDPWRPQPYELPYCKTCNGLLDWPMSDFCTSPKSACDCDGHSLYRYIRAEREPHPPMLPRFNHRELHKPLYKRNKNKNKDESGDEEA